MRNPETKRRFTMANSRDEREALSPGEDARRDYGPENNLNLKVVISLSRGVAALNRNTMKNMKSFGLTSAQFMVLEILYHKGEMRVCDITEKILSTAGNMTVVIGNLLKDGYVEKMDTVGDRRSYSLRLTMKGREIIERVFPKHLEILREELDSLEDEEKEELVRLMKKMQRRED